MKHLATLDKEIGKLTEQRNKLLAKRATELAAELEAINSQLGNGGRKSAKVVKKNSGVRVKRGKFQETLRETLQSAGKPLTAKELAAAMESKTKILGRAVSEVDTVRSLYSASQHPETSKIAKVGRGLFQFVNTTDKQPVAA